MVAIPRWHVKGDWFDVCRCSIPCPCTFAQPPTFEECDGVLAWHVREGRYGDVVLNGLNVLALAYFKGNVWTGAKVSLGMYVDSHADGPQREAMQKIFGGQVGGWPAQFAQTIGELRGIEFAPIEFEVAGDLAYWRAAIPNRVEARGEVLVGPTTLPGQRVQTHNPPGCETGPNGVATWGRATVDKVDGFGFRWNRTGQSSKHIPFDWTGPGG
jgi:hypothetical protein